MLVYPLVSPIYQGSLGNLPPLYIIAGDGEVLRDEIIYLAHKAAQPTRFPTGSLIRRECRRQRENTETFRRPTKVFIFC
jgi:acetyl esterase/lipase